MQRHSRDDAGDAGDVRRRRDLSEHDQADHGRRRRQQRDHQRVGRARQAGHRELIGHVRDHRRGDADADAREQRDGVGERGRGLPDLRRSFRRAVGTGGEMLSLARRGRAADEPRLVVLCDTSGSMDVHVKFVLAFVLALKRVARSTEVFAFNTSLTRLTPWLLPGKIGRTIERLAAAAHRDQVDRRGGTGVRVDRVHDR